MKIVIKIPEAMQGMRLDQAVARLLPAYSRARLQRWIRGDQVIVNGKIVRPRHIVGVGDDVEISVPQPKPADIQPQDIPLKVVHEDADLIVIDKPAGLVVHPGAGNPDGTLQNGLLYHYPELGEITRHGIVHRLDKGTSGLMVVARSHKVHTSLVRQLQSHKMGREYEAVIQGRLIAGGVVDAPLGRHRVDRKRMTTYTGGRPAITHYRVIQRFVAHSHVSVQLETGRTHQIRVHMAHIKHPVVGDPVYGGRNRLPAGCGQNLRQLLQSFPRQALHARALRLSHPGTGEVCRWTSDLPADIHQLLEVLGAGPGHERTG